MTVLRPTLYRMRRVSSLLLTVIVGSAVLTACGDDATKDDASRPAAGAGFPRSVTHAMGTTEIKKKPRRVVVLDTGELDDVTTLGITPVGAVSPT
ncbi:hypothetical protein [Streptomyces griseocarneus]|uniref:hypothetical protein n=1 Tax=Streptomyces griseocarneus TaxID=51201 RepID=UPI00325A5F1E